MSFQSENVIPGDHGMTFTTNINDEEEFIPIKEILMRNSGVRDVQFDKSVYPHQVVIHTNNLVHVNQVQDATDGTPFHLIPKTLFGL